MLELKRAVVAERYFCTLDQDVVIHIGCFSGNISNINECGAAALVKSKYPGFYEKPPAVDETPEDVVSTLVDDTSLDDEQTI